MISLREKRQDERFAMEMPVLLESGIGISRDISESGIYFLTDRQLAPGGVIRFSVKLDHVRPGKTVRLDCAGKILRVEPAGGKFGVAASITEAWCINQQH